MCDNARSAFILHSALHHARAAYIINALPAHVRTYERTLLYYVYDLFLAARSAPSQLCFIYDTACSGCSYMMEYTERVQQGASEASPLLVLISLPHIIK